MLRLAQAASSEAFSAWGVPPNQRRTGATEADPGGNMDGELNIVPFYGGWAAVFRPVDHDTAERIAYQMEGAVYNGNHAGYGQNNQQYPREGVFDVLFEMAKPDTRNIRKLVNCDCSSLAGASVYAAGVYEPALRTMWTGTEPQILMGTGKFIRLDDPLLLELGTGLRRGDILWKPGHTAVAIDTDDHADTYPVLITGCAYTRIRSGPGVEYGTQATISSGTILNAYGTAQDEDGDIWYRVSYDGIMGYTSAVFARTLPTAAVTGDVWMREGAGTGNKEIIVIPKGTPDCYLTGATKPVMLTLWHECVYGGHIGWASGKYVKERS